MRNTILAALLASTIIGCDTPTPDTPKEVDGVDPQVYSTNVALAHILHSDDLGIVLILSNTLHINALYLDEVLCHGTTRENLGFEDLKRGVIYTLRYRIVDIAGARSTNAGVDAIFNCLSISTLDQ